MNLVLFTSTYPYGYDESFIENELRIAEKKFEYIYIICRTAKVAEYVQYIPHNAIVIKRPVTFGTILRAVVNTCSLSTIKDMWYSYNTLNQKVDLYTVKKIIDANVNAVAAKRLANDFSISDDYVVYSYWLDGLAWGAISFGKQIKARSIVARAHGVDCFVARGYQPFRREMLSYLDAVYSVSEAGAADISENVVTTIHSPKNIADIKVARLGVFGGAFNPELKGDSIIVVSCSHIIRLKRLDLLIDALGLINGISVKWIHIGEGELAEEIKKYAKEKLAEKTNISFQFMGRMENEAIRKFYETEHIDIFVNCSDYEGLPVSIMEAMAHGIPVLARNVGGNKEIINNEAGWLLPEKDNPCLIAEIISGVANMSEEETQQRRKAAVDTWNKKFSAENNYNIFYDAILSIGADGMDLECENKG